MTTLPTLDTLGVEAFRRVPDTAADDDLAYYGFAVVLARAPGATGAGVLNEAVVGGGLVIDVVTTNMFIGMVAF